MKLHFFRFVQLSFYIEFKRITVIAIALHICYVAPKHNTLYSVMKLGMSDKHIYHKSASFQMVCFDCGYSHKLYKMAATFLISIKALC